MSDGAVPSGGAPETPRPAGGLPPFIAWMSKHGHWIVLLLLLSEVLFEGWALHDAKRREAERAAPPAPPAAQRPPG